MNGPDDFPGPVNLGNDTEITIMELAEKIISMTESHSKLVFRPLPMDDPVRRRPDLSLALKKLGWHPVVSIEEGLGKTIAYFRDAK